MGEVRRLERLLPIACAGSAVLLFASEFMNTFVISEAVRGGICELAASDRHFYSLAVLAAFALVALVVALSGSKPAAIAVAACGVISLGLFLAIDLPDATATGTLGEGCSPIEGSFAEVSVDPQVGFWIALAGALGLAMSGLALATFSNRQLAQLGPAWLRRRLSGDAGEGDGPSAGAKPERGGRRRLGRRRGKRDKRGSRRPPASGPFDVESDSRD